MNPRNGKIARFPPAVREELNQRLQKGEQGEALLTWLNGLREVKTVVRKEFAGVAVTKQNLSEWRNGGFVEWGWAADRVQDSGEIEAEAEALGRVTHGRLADHLATVLAGRYAALVRHWDGTVTDEFRAQLKVLRGMTLDIAQLRRWDHSAGRLRIEQDNHDAQREKTEAEVVAHFEEWIKNPAVHDWIMETWVPKKERIRRRQEMFGLNEKEQARERKNAGRRKARAKKKRATNGGKSKDRKASAKENSSCQGPAASHRVAPSRTNANSQNSIAKNQNPIAKGPGEGEGKSKDQNPKSNSEAEESKPVKAGQTTLTAAESPAGPPNQSEPVKGARADGNIPGQPEVPGGLLWGRGLPPELRPYRPSLCKGKCALEDGVCQGCRRTVAEIIRWPSLSVENRNVKIMLVLDRLKGRPC